LFELEGNRPTSEKKFCFLVINREGKKTKGEIKAVNEGDALEILSQKGYVILNLKKKKEINFRIKPGIKKKEVRLLHFSRQLGTLLEGGVPLGEALNLLSQQAVGKTQKKIFGDIRNKVFQGNSLFSGVSEHPGFFPQFFCQMVKMGEETGLISMVMNNLADHFERKLAFKREIKEAVRYPLFVFAVALGVKGFLLFQVLPFFSSLYLDFGQELPILTQRLIFLSFFVKENAFFFPLIVLGMALLCRFFKPRGKFKFWLDGQLARFWAVRKIYWANLANNLSLLLKAGLPLDRSLEVASKQIGNSFFQKKMTQTKEEVEQGEMVSQAIEKILTPDPFFICMLRIGEETGNLDEMTDQIGSYYQNEMENWLKNLISFLEPLMILIIAGFISLIMVGMLLPMLEMVQVW